MKIININNKSKLYIKKYRKTKVYKKHTPIIIYNWGIIILLIKTINIKYNIEVFKFF